MKGERHCHRRMGREEISHRVFLQNKRASGVYQPPRRVLTQDPNRRYIRKVSFAAELICLAGGLYGCMLAFNNLGCFPERSRSFVHFHNFVVVADVGSRATAARAGCLRTVTGGESSKRDQ